MKRPGAQHLRAGAACLVAVALAASGPLALRLSVAASGRPVHADAPIVQIAADTVAPKRDTGAVSATATHPAATPALGAQRPGTPLAWRNVLVHGQVRKYLLATPGATGPRPLLVVLHGLNQHTQGFLATTGVVKAALAAGVAVVGPETPDGSWNDGRFGATGRDDDGYVMAIVDQLVAERVAAPRQVVLVGFSNGAGLSIELVSRHPDAFGAMVLVGGELLAGPGMPLPQSAVPTILLHGTDDPVQPWDGRARRGPRMPAQVGVPATVAAFVRAAGAGAPAPAEDLPHTAGRIPVTAQRWSGQAEVTLYRLVGAGHVWPVTTCPPGSCRPSADVARLADVSATALAVQTALNTAR